MIPTYTFMGKRHFLVPFYGICLLLYFEKVFASMIIGIPPSNRFCQVCDESSGFSGITIAVHKGETKIRCTLRCHSIPECDLASYNENTKVCKLLTNVTQYCTETTKDIQLMDENDIIPITTTTAATTTKTSSMSTISSTSLFSTTAGMIPGPLGTTTSTAPNSTTTTTPSTTSTATTTSSTTLATTPSSGHPWIVALTYNFTQNGTQVPTVHNLLDYALSGADVNLLVETYASYLFFPIDWFKVSYYAANMCVKNFAYYLYSYFKPKKSANSLCLSSAEITEYAWPEMLGLPITVTSTFVYSTYFFTRDYPGGYTFSKGSISSADLQFIRQLIRDGSDIRFRVGGAEVYSADLIYFSQENDNVFALIRKYAVVDEVTGSLDFLHILHTIDGGIGKLTETKAGDINMTVSDGSEEMTDVLLQGQWQKVYEIAKNGAVTQGSYAALQNAVRKGHRVKIMAGGRLSAKVDAVIELPGEDRLVAILLDEFNQYEGRFLLTETQQKLWREIDTLGIHRRILLGLDYVIKGDDSSNEYIAWFVDSDNWAPYHVSQEGGEDTTALVRAVKQGSRVRLQYRDAGQTDNPRVFIDTVSVMLTNTTVEAITTRSLLFNYANSSSMHPDTADFLQWKFRTDGTANRYLKEVGGSGLHTASSIIGGYEVTWYTDQVN